MDVDYIRVYQDPMKRSIGCVVRATSSTRTVS
jgi:hypothetical protein